MSDPRIDRALAGCPPIRLPELDAVELACRAEVKYLITRAAFEQAAGRLAERHVRLQICGLTTFRYRSTYFDTPELTAFQAHRQGRRLRWKARTRLYVDSGRRRIEVKLKDGRGRTDKRAVLTDRDDASAVRAFLASVLAPDYGIPPPRELYATLTVENHRATVADLGDGTRVTVDTGLRMVAGRRAGELHPELVLVEVKSPTGRSAADRILRAAEAQQLCFSKYCAGIVLTRPGVPEQPWRRLVSSAFRTVPGAGTEPEALSA